MARAEGTGFWRRIVSKVGFGYSFFISYAAEHASYASAVKRELEKRGWITFLDSADIFTGNERQAAGKRLVSAIRASGVLLLIDTARTREKVWPAREVEAAVLLWTTIVRIEVPGTPQSWPALSPKALAEVNGGPRYPESAENVVNGTPSPQLLDGLAAHLNWRRYWPIVHRTLLVVACVGTVVVVAQQKVASVAAGVDANPITAAAAAAADPLFGGLNPLFAVASPSQMATIRRRLLDMPARQLAAAPRAAADIALHCGEDQDDPGPLTADELVHLKSLVDVKNTNQWHVDPTGRYLLAVGGLKNISRVWSIDLIRRQAADPMIASWPNDGREICVTSFDAAGNVALFGQRSGARAELSVRAMPSGLPLGESLLLPGRFPSAIDAQTRVSSVTTEMAITHWLMAPHPPRAVIWANAGLPYSGRVGPDGLLALAYDGQKFVEVCRLTGGQLECAHVWADAQESVEPELIVIDVLRSIGNGRIELRLHTRVQQVACAGQALSDWSCHTDGTASGDASAVVSRDSCCWTLTAAAPDNQFDRFHASIARRFRWAGTYRTLDRPGRLLDASFRGDLLEILWAWPHHAVVVEEIALTESAVQQRIREGFDAPGGSR